MMFSGRHAERAQYHNVVVLSVGYRRSRMPAWVFFGLYPVRAAAVLSLFARARVSFLIHHAAARALQLVLLLGASLATAPFVLAGVYLLDLPVYAVPAPAVVLFLVCVSPKLCSCCGHLDPIGLCLALQLGRLIRGHSLPAQILLFLGHISVR